MKTTLTTLLLVSSASVLAAPAPECKARSGAPAPQASRTARTPASRSL